MGELDEAWAAALSEAEHRARLAGRKDVAEYLSLKKFQRPASQGGSRLAGRRIYERLPAKRIAPARVFKSQTKKAIVFRSAPRRWSDICSRSLTVFALCTSKPAGPGAARWIRARRRVSRAPIFVTWGLNPLSEELLLSKSSTGAPPGSPFEETLLHPRV